MIGPHSHLRSIKNGQSQQTRRHVNVKTLQSWENARNSWPLCSRLRFSTDSLPFLTNIPYRYSLETFLRGIPCRYSLQTFLTLRNHCPRLRRHLFSMLLEIIDDVAYTSKKLPPCFESEIKEKPQEVFLKDDTCFPGVVVHFYFTGVSKRRVSILETHRKETWAFFPRNNAFFEERF